MIFGYLLLGLAESHTKVTRLFETTTGYLLSLRDDEGHWRSREKRRPPLEASDFTATALMVRALSAYRPLHRSRESTQAVIRAVGWLRMHVPIDTEDRTFRLFGLYWAHADAAALAQAGDEILAHQRSDGGWSQSDDGESDAYATGESLVALGRSGSVKPDDPRFQKGIDFLLRSQEPGGSWQVGSRAHPFQRYFETGFPHGKDQFISYAATCWATMAVLSDYVEQHREER